MRKFHVRANFREPLAHRIRQTQKENTDSEALSVREFDVFADDEDDAKVRAKHLMKDKGHEEKSLQHVTWTVSRLDRPRGKKKRNK